MNQLDATIVIYYHKYLYMFRAPVCQSSGVQVVCYCIWCSALGVVVVVLKIRCVVLCTIVASSWYITSFSYMMNGHTNIKEVSILLMHGS
jgi:hypothetical protein